MYRRYSLFATKTSPFLWGHRLEFPLLGGLVGWAIAIVLGRAFEPNEFRSTYDAISIQFFMIAFATVLVTVTWLVSVSRTLDLPQSYAASRFPIFSVVALGVMFLNAPAYLFANIAISRLPEFASRYEPGWPLFNSTSGNPWDLFGLMFGLVFVSLFAVFAVLAKRCGVTQAILSLFCCLGLVVGLSLVGIALGPQGKSEGRVLGLAAFGLTWGLLLVLNVSLWRKRLFRGHALVSSISLFATSFALVLLAIATAGVDGFQFRIQVMAFAASLALGEAIMAIIRGKRYRVS